MMRLVCRATRQPQRPTGEDCGRDFRPERDHRRCEREIHHPFLILVIPHSLILRTRGEMTLLTNPAIL